MSDAPAFDFPEVFVRADSISLDGQRAFLRWTRAQLILLVTAGVAGVWTWTSGDLDLAALVAAALFFIAAGLRLAMNRTRPHQDWYDGRAGAESIKTLAWRYAVGGAPFALEDDRVGEVSFERRVKETLQGLPRLADRLSEAESRPTASMQALRRWGRSERADAYLIGRIEDQRTWYDAKAAWNESRARFWGVSILVLQVVAAGGALAKGFGIVDIDLFGIAAAVVASAAAWLATKQHGTVAAGYRVAADELGEISPIVKVDRTESEWAAFVSDSEEAISREHTMWLASASQRRPAELV